MQENSDNEIIGQALKSSISSYDIPVKCYQWGPINFSFRYLVSWQEAEEIVQDVLYDISSGLAAWIS